MFTKIKKGFTLVELIVVIAIIAILAAILIPMLLNQTRNSRCTQETGNLKTIASKIGERLTTEFTGTATFADACDIVAADFGTGVLTGDIYTITGTGNYDRFTMVISGDTVITIEVARTAGHGHTYHSLRGSIPESFDGTECENATCPVRRTTS